MLYKILNKQLSGNSYTNQGRQNKCESGEAQRMDIELHWQLPKAV